MDATKPFKLDTKDSSNLPEAPSRLQNREDESLSIKQTSQLASGPDSQDVETTTDLKATNSVGALLADRSEEGAEVINLTQKQECLELPALKKDMVLLTPSPLEKGETDPEQTSPTPMSGKLTCALQLSTRDSTFDGGGGHGCESNRQSLFLTPKGNSNRSSVMVTSNHKDRREGAAGEAYKPRKKQTEHIQITRETQKNTSTELQHGLPVTNPSESTFKLTNSLVSNRLIEGNEPTSSPATEIKSGTSKQFVEDRSKQGRWAEAQEARAQHRRKSIDAPKRTHTEETAPLYGQEINITPVYCLRKCPSAPPQIPQPENSIQTEKSLLELSVNVNLSKSAPHISSQSRETGFGIQGAESAASESLRPPEVSSAQNKPQSSAQLSQEAPTISVSPSGARLQDASADTSLYLDKEKASGIHSVLYPVSHMQDASATPALTPDLNTQDASATLAPASLALPCDSHSEYTIADITLPSDSNTQDAPANLALPFDSHPQDASTTGSPTQDVLANVTLPSDSHTQDTPVTLPLPSDSHSQDASALPYGSPKHDASAALALPSVSHSHDASANLALPSDSHSQDASTTLALHPQDVSATISLPPDSPTQDAFANATLPSDLHTQNESLNLALPSDSHPQDAPSNLTLHFDSHPQDASATVASPSDSHTHNASANLALPSDSYSQDASTILALPPHFNTPDVSAYVALPSDSHAHDADSQSQNASSTLTLHPHPHALTCLAFSPDSHTQDAPENLTLPPDPHSQNAPANLALPANSHSLDASTTLALPSDPHKQSSDSQDASDTLASQLDRASACSSPSGLRDTATTPPLPNHAEDAPNVPALRPNSECTSITDSHLTSSQVQETPLQSLERPSEAEASTQQGVSFGQGGGFSLPTNAIPAIARPSTASGSQPPVEVAFISPASAALRQLPVGIQASDSCDDRRMTSPCVQIILRGTELEVNHTSCDYQAVPCQEEEEAPADVHVYARRPEARGDVSQILHQWQLTRHNSSRRRSCHVCHNRHSNSFFQVCHVLACDRCWRSLSQCPVCQRQNFGFVFLP